MRFSNLLAVRRSLAENDLTVVSIFVNPAQFAPHEDLSTYPRTLPRDLEVLQSLAVETESGTHKPLAVFVPTVYDMYPSGISQNVAEQKGTFVEVKGYSHQMEGKTRPTFFRGVATVVTKLFNVIEVRALALQTPSAPAEYLLAHADVFRPKGYSAGAPAPTNDSRPASVTPYSGEPPHHPNCPVGMVHRLACHVTYEEA